MDDKIFDRIDDLMKSQGKKMKDLLNYLGLSHSTYDNWKTGKSRSYTKYIDKICEFLHVTPNYLVSGSNIGVLPTDETEYKEDELIRLFRSVSKETQDYVLAIMRLNLKMLQNGTL